MPDISNNQDSLSTLRHYSDALLELERIFDEAGSFHLDVVLKQNLLGELFCSASLQHNYLAELETMYRPCHVDLIPLRNAEARARFTSVCKRVSELPRITATLADNVQAVAAVAEALQVDSEPILRLHETWHPKDLRSAKVAVRVVLARYGAVSQAECPIVLEPPAGLRVLGKFTQVSLQQFCVVQLLVKKFPQGVSKDELEQESGCPAARRLLRQLEGNELLRPWIQMAGKKGGKGYRIRAAAEHKTST